MEMTQKTQHLLLLVNLESLSIASKLLNTICSSLQQLELSSTLEQSWIVIQDTTPQG